MAKYAAGQQEKQGYVYMYRVYMSTCTQQKKLGEHPSLFFSFPGGSTRAYPKKILFDSSINASLQSKKLAIFSKSSPLKESL